MVEWKFAASKFEFSGDANVEYLIKFSFSLFLLFFRPKADSSKTLILGMGDCIPVRPWNDSPIECLAEIRMIWRDKNEQSLLISLRLYFLPENTPQGRNCHGEVREFENINLIKSSLHHLTFKF